jgi:hypothetical protein
MKKDITTKLADNSREPITVAYNFGDNLADSVSIFGEEVVNTRWVAAGTVDFQGAVRTLMRAKDEEGNFKHTDKDIIKAMNEWKPGIKKPAKSAKEKALELLAGLSEEEQQEILEKALAGDVG